MSKDRKTLDKIKKKIIILYITKHFVERQNERVKKGEEMNSKDRKCDCCWLGIVSRLSPLIATICTAFAFNLTRSCVNSQSLETGLLNFKDSRVIVGNS